MTQWGQVASDYVILLFVIIGVKSVIFGQYWPWQHKHRCPYCKRAWGKA